MNVFVAIRLGLIASFLTSTLASMLSPSDVSGLVEPFLTSLESVAQTGCSALIRLVDPAFWQELVGCVPRGSNPAEWPWT